MAIQFLSDKKTLLNLILPALAATSGKSTLPALEGLLFKLEDNVLTVCGYDLEKACVRAAWSFPRKRAR